MFSDTHVILVIVRKQFEELLQEDDELLGHGLEFVNETVGVDIAEAGAHGVVDKEEVCKLVPCSVVQGQCTIVLNAVWPNLHQCAVFRAASRSTIQPDDSSLPVRNMFVLEMPEK